MNERQSERLQTTEESPTQRAINKIQSEFVKTGVFDAVKLAQIMGSPTDNMSLTAPDNYATSKAAK